MQGNLKILAACICTLLAVPSFAASPQLKHLVANTPGEGTIRIGDEEFKLHAIVVKLFENGKAEINLITDITVFIKGTWSRGDQAENAINLVITGNVTSSSLEGTGKLFLTANRKSITGLKAEVLNKTSKKTINIDFVAK